MEGLNITFPSTQPALETENIVMSNTCNDSQTTIDTSTHVNLSLNNLQNENQMLRKKIDFLQKIISLKDNTIDDLNSKLNSLSLSNNTSTIPQSQSQSQSQSPSRSSSKSNKGTTVNPLDSPIKQHQKLSNSISSSSHNNNWEIPQRNSNRKPHLHKSDSSTSQPLKSSHTPRYSVSSTTSSHYSDNIQKRDSAAEITQLTDESHNLSNDPNNNSTLDLEDHLNFGELTLGSSPRKASPNRHPLNLDFNDDLNDSVTMNNSQEIKFTDEINTEEQLTAKNSAVDNADENNYHGDHIDYNNNNNNNNNDDDDDFHFGLVPEIDEPVYRKLNTQQDSLYSVNSSPKIEYFPTKTPINDQFDINKQSLITPSSQYSTDNSILDSITGTPTNQLQNTILNPLTTLQNIQTLPSTTNSPPPIPKSPPPIPKSPPPIPNHPPSLPTNHTSHKRILSTDDSEKFLLNSLAHAVIRIESLIDPTSLAVPIDSISNNIIAKNKRDNYRISFLVFTDENPASLTPIYRVKKSYVELLHMDRTVRPLVPNLPKLPEFPHIAGLNYKYWANSKRLIQSYINKLLLLLKSQNPLDQNNPIWKHFSNYFEFKIDPNNLDDPEFSVLNLQNKICYLLYIRKNFANKTYDFVNLNFQIESNELVMNFLLSKSQEILSKDEVYVSFKNQEIIIKRKKKFATNKSWVFYVESDYDASELCSNLKSWIGSSNDLDDTNYDEKYLNNESNDNIKLDDHDSTKFSSDIANSPSITTPWKIFKKSNKQIPTSPKASSSSNSLTLSVPPTPSKINSPTSLTPSSNATTFNDVLNFKAMPYESNKFTADIDDTNNNTSSSNLMLKSPTKNPNERPNQIVFQPIDDTPKYFKSTLQYSYDLCPKYKLYGFDVPSIVYQSISFLYQQSGEGFEGIFRLNGMMSEVNKIQEIFNSQNDCELSTLSPLPDVHSIATLLKRYLRNIKDKLISNEVASELCDIINHAHSKKKTEFSSDLFDKDDKSLSSLSSSTAMLDTESTQAFRQIFINDVPQLNRNVLYVLFKYLRDVLKMGKHNKMTISAMSVLMGPNLTQSDGGGQICVVLLENFNQIFA